MKNIVLHVEIGNRRTTVTIHPTLVELASIKLTGSLSGRKEVCEWLSKELVDQLGENHPKSNQVKSGLTKYAMDAITSLIADPDLVEKRKVILYD